MIYAIQARNLSKIYNEGKENEFVALEGIDLQVCTGEMVVIKGVSGSGKSTLMSLLGALSRPSGGDILINGDNIAKLPDIYASRYRNQEVGFVFQSFNLLDGLSVYENVKVPLALSACSQKEIDEKVKYAMHLANITHKEAQQVSKLSGGEKQRCAIARALVNDPCIILADEPTANLDRDNSALFVDILAKFKELKKTVVIVTHDTIFDDLRFIDKTLHMQDGRFL